MRSPAADGGTLLCEGTAALQLVNAESAAMARGRAFDMRARALACMPACVPACACSRLSVLYARYGLAGGPAPPPPGGDFMPPDNWPLP